MNKETQDSTQTVEIRSYTKKELCNLYGISKNVLRRWLEIHQEFLGSKYKKTFNVTEVEYIFAHFGIPKKLSL